MADFTKGTFTVTLHTYRLETPTNGVEVSKMLRAAAHDYRMHFGVDPDQVPDDALQVSADDDHIEVTWEVG